MICRALTFVFVSASVAITLAITFASAAAGCQIVAGVDDRQLANPAALDGGSDSGPPMDAGAGANSDAFSAPQDDASDAKDDATPMCTPPFGDCNHDPRDGCETNLTSDKKHCGVCGHDCLGGDCLAAKCQPFPIAFGQTNPVSLAADETTIYFTTLGTQIPSLYSDGTVMAVPLAAADAGTTPAAPTALATGLISPHAIALDADRVYWASDNLHTIESVRRVDGTNRMSLVDGADGGAGKVAALAVDDTYVYWLDQGSTDNGGSLWRVTKNGGGTPQRIADSLWQPRDIALLGTAIYFTERGDLTPNSQHGALDFLDMASINKTVVPLYNGPTESVALANGNVYFVGYGPDPTGGHVVATLKSMRANGSALPDLAELGQTSSTAGIAADTSNVYVNTYIGSGQILRVPAQGGSATPVATNTIAYSETGMVANTKGLYWAVTNDGKVMGLAK